MPSTLPGGAEQPFTAQVSSNVIVGDNAAGGYIGSAELNLAKHVQVIENVFERAVVRKSVEKVTNCVFGVHWALQAGLLPGKIS